MNNSIALVTGGAGHIGRETCIKLAQKNCRIIIVDKNEEAAMQQIKELKNKYSCDCLFIHADLLDSNCFQEVYSQVNDMFGELDFLVNCAGFYDDTPGWGVNFEKESYEAWTKVLQVNTLAPFFFAQSLSPLLKKSKNGAIVNVSSIYGIVAPDHTLYEGLNMTNPAAYGVSKSGLQQVSKWLCSVLAPKVRVNTVTPGGVERGQNPIFKERYEAKTPLKRMATEEDIANAITYLLSEESKYITGHNLIVDGGWTVW